jgi:protein phosphatase
LRLAAAAVSDAGRVRAVNEDKAAVAEDLVAIADGMGGHAGGEVAASTAIEALVGSFSRNRSVKGLLAAVQQANRAVYDQSVHDRSLRGMGTTLTAAAVVRQRSGDKIVIVNVGDSRAYLLDGSGLARLTEDHSLVEEMVRRGELTAAEAAVHPHRHIVTRVLGIDEDVEVDAWELEPLEGSRLLLCSDGLTNELDDGELAEILAERRPAEETARELVERALGHGGSDNVTVVVVDLLAGGESPDGALRAGASDATDAPPAGAVPPGGPGVGAPLETAPPGAGSSPVAGRKTGRPAEAGAGTDGPSGLPAPGSGSAGTADATGWVPIAPAPVAAAGGDHRDGAGSSAGTATAGAAAAPAKRLTRASSAADPLTVARPAAPGDGRRAARRRGGAGEPAPARAAAAPGRAAADTAAVPVAAAARSGPARSGPVRAVVPAGRILLPAGSAGVAGVQRPVAARIRHERIMTFRVAFFVLLLVAVLGGAAGFVGWFVRASYFVGVVDGHVAILEGRPGGFLWFHPTLVERTTLAESSVFAPTRTYLEAGMEQPSLAAARRVVAQLASRSAYLALPTGSTSRANGVPTGSTLVPISSPVPTLPPPPPTVATTAPPATAAPTKAPAHGAHGTAAVKAHTSTGSPAGGVAAVHPSRTRGATRSTVAIRLPHRPVGAA